MKQTLRNFPEQERRGYGSEGWGFEYLRARQVKRSRHQTSRGLRVKSSSLCLAGGPSEPQPEEHDGQGERGAADEHDRGDRSDTGEESVEDDLADRRELPAGARQMSVSCHDITMSTLPVAVTATVRPSTVGCHCRTSSIPRVGRPPAGLSEGRRPAE